jgi:hypothetical protein
MADDLVQEDLVQGSQILRQQECRHQAASPWVGTQRMGCVHDAGKVYLLTIFGDCYGLSTQAGSFVLQEVHIDGHHVVTAHLL